MKRILLILFFCFTGFTPSFAQKTTPADSAKTAVKAVILELEQMRNANDVLPVVHELLGGKVTRIKVNPLLALSGDMPVYLEREIAKKLSAEVSVGVTYDNIFADLIEESKYDLDLTKEGRHGISASAALRFYPAEGGEKMERYYFSPEVRYRLYKSAITRCSGYDVNIPQTRQVTDAKLIVGYLNYIGDNVFVDFYGGVGMRQKQYTNKLESFTIIYDPATATNLVKPDLHNKTDYTMLLSLGFKLGFNF